MRDEVYVTNYTSTKYTEISMVSCQKGPTRHAYAWQIGPFWQDTLDMWLIYCPAIKWPPGAHYTNMD